MYRDVQEYTILKISISQKNDVENPFLKLLRSGGKEYIIVYIYIYICVCVYYYYFITFPGDIKHCEYCDYLFFGLVYFKPNKFSSISLNYAF